MNDPSDGGRANRPEGQPGAVPRRGLLQFAGYALCGGVATAVDTAVFYAFAWRLIPALGADDPLVRLLGLAGPFVDEDLRSLHFLVNRAIAFVFSNFTAYLLNARWVFQPGRHRRSVEIGLFYACSLLSVGVGTLAGWLLIHLAGWSTTASYACNLVAAVLINFAARKYWVFRG